MTELDLPTNEAIEKAAHTRLQDCYQCGKCSAGCPMSESMDLLPHQLIQLTRRGKVEKAAASQAIWSCVSCQTCTTRCPKNVDCASILDALRQTAVEQALGPSRCQSTQLFHQAFLGNIRRHGRLNEIELVGAFKTSVFLKQWRPTILTKDASLGPQLLRRRKLHLRRQRVKDRAVVRRIFDRCMAKECFDA
jgi:heterodisulfide reductase subunit C